MMRCYSTWNIPLDQNLGYLRRIFRRDKLLMKFVNNRDQNIIFENELSSMEMIESLSTILSWIINKSVNSFPFHLLYFIIVITCCRTNLIQIKRYVLNWSFLLPINSHQGVYYYVFQLLRWVKRKVWPMKWYFSST
jgi:hypothetical protein